MYAASGCHIKALIGFYLTRRFSVLGDDLAGKFRTCHLSGLRKGLNTGQCGRLPLTVGRSFSTDFSYTTLLSLEKSAKFYVLFVWLLKINHPVYPLSLSFLLLLKPFDFSARLENFRGQNFRVLSQFFGRVEKSFPM